LLTAIARRQQHSNTAAWSGSLIITAAGILSVQSANLVTLLLTWTAIDLIELGILLFTGQDKDTDNRAVFTFSMRVTGTILVLAAAVQSPQTWYSFDFFSAPTQSALFFLIGIGLRVGLLPFHLPYQAEPPMRRGVGTVLRLVTASTCLVALARIPSGVVETGGATVLLCITALAAFYSALSWVTSRDELAGRPFWITTLAALAITSVIRGFPQGAMVWGTVLILSGGCLFLFSARNLKVAYIPVLGLWGLAGLPFSPAASGWAGLTVGPVPILNGIFIASHVFLVLGYARHALKVGEPLNGMERWVQLIYPFGLMILPIIHLALGLGGWDGSRTVGVWWASLCSVFFSSLFGYGYYRFGYGLPAVSGPSPWNWWRTALGKVYVWITGALSLAWLYRLIGGFYRFLGRLVNIVTIILEGDGGVLWAFVLLILLLTILRTGGVG
jgi:hypothetical protein